MAMLYLALAVGALTTVYPFFLMISTAVKGPTDQNDNRMVPLYWQDQGQLEAKYRDDKYSGDLSLMDSMEIGATASPEELDQYRQLLMDLPLDQWQAGFRTASGQVTSRLDREYQIWLKEKYGTIKEVNAAYLELNPAFQTVSVPTERLDSPDWQPKGNKKWQDWLEFKATLPAEFRIPIRGQRLWQEHLRTKHGNRIANVPDEQRRGVDNFEQIPFPEDSASLTELRESTGARFDNGFIEEKWEGGPLPMLALERQILDERAPELKREFAGRNFRYVLDYIVINGRALWNTLIFCGLAILTQLIVNPLAAYALSRFPMKASAQILLFLLATMAFPAEVAMIPAFLLLKDLHLLNTFAALVLPTAASGFMIFLLKGFFDSLPREIFESGQIDGAKESTMMMRLAMPLSKPVLGYLALLAFMGSYGTFMYAFLVAQDREMWTLMVFIYQLQGFAPKAVMMAAVTLAAIPTLIVFLLAQRVIMRGIILPGER